MFDRKILDQFRIPPGKRIRLADYEPGWAKSKELEELGKDSLKQRAQDILNKNIQELAEAQELLWANDTYSVLVILQALDAAGKDGTIKHVVSGVNPQGCRVYSFKRPSAEELDHTFLWRQMKVVPERGQICIFNRSHYEDVLVVRVHPELIGRSGIPKGKKARRFWRDRFDDINSFERHLARNGTLILKFFLHISKDEQKRRFLDRLADPRKHWKFSVADLAERQHWDAYMAAYEEVFAHTSTDWAPWYIVPANHKWVARAMVAEILAGAIRDLKLEYPSLREEQERELAAARKTLANEKDTD